MPSRLKLQEELEHILNSRNVYFQPPTNIKLSYPCIIYKLSDIKKFAADDTTYIGKRNYTITLMHRDPDNTVVDEIMKLPYCSFDSYYSADNLHHYVFDIYY